MRPQPVTPSSGPARSRGGLQPVLDALPLAVWTTDANLFVTSVSGAALDPLAEAAVGMPVEDAFGDDATEAIGAHRRALDGHAQSFHAVRGTDTFSFYVEPLRGDDGEVIGVAGLALQTTEQRRVEDTLRDVMRGYRAIAELTSDFAYSIRILDEGDLTFEWVTDGFEALTGFERNEVNAVGLLTMVHPEDADIAQRVLAGAVQGETVTLEHRIVTRSGETKWVRSYGVPETDPDGKVVRILGAVEDISEHKTTEEELARTADELRRTDRERLRLLVHLVRAQDEERKRIAEGIHDDSIQLMATLGLRLEALAKRLDDPTIRREMDALHGMVSESMGRLRTLLFELAPPALKDEGLAVAIEQLAGRIAEHDDRMAFSVHDRVSRELPEGSRLLLFRLAQEALTNVRKHARASEVEVRLEEQDGGVLLEVRDDGVGFSTAEPVPPGHLGLIAMRERAEMARGWWRLDSEPGSGTTVRVWVPVADEAVASRTT